MQTCVTSPPYWGLRAYAGAQSFAWGGDPDHAHEWGERRARVVAHEPSQSSTLDGGKGPRQASSVTRDALCACGAWYGALGLEPTPDLYVEHMVQVFREVRRVLRPGGTLWLNLGDSYAGSWGAQGRTGQMADRSVISARQIEAHPQRSSHTGSIRSEWGVKAKDALLIPHRVAIALCADGWTVRADIVWSKPNPMPESVTDRPTKSHEYVFLLAKSERYFYDADAIRDPVQASSIARVSQNGGHPTFAAARERRENGHISGRDTLRADQLVPEGGRNARSVWEIATQPYPGAHFATFPEELPRRCILAGSASGDVVLDPFAGSGTTVRVANRLGRRGIGLDISREYLVEQALARVDPIAAARRSAASGIGQGTLL